MGSPCIWCGESIEPGDRVRQTNDGQGQVHFECLVRMIGGSVGHQRGRCHCHGGTEEDPPGLTRREAARAAEALWRAAELVRSGARVRTGRH